MVGRDISEPLNRAEIPTGPALLTLEDIRLPAREGSVALTISSLSIASGRVLALAGVGGNGQIGWPRPLPACAARRQADPDRRC
jgi:ABC-type uncharacterized transport system ATPase subunit